MCCVIYYKCAIAELRCGFIQYDSVFKTDKTPAEVGQFAGNGHLAVI